MLSMPHVFGAVLAAAAIRFAACSIANCSASADFGSASATGKTIIGRNSDWDTKDNERISKMHAITVFKNGNQSVVGVGLIGMLFPTTLFNPSHIFIAALDSYPGSQALSVKGTRSQTADLRYALETYTTLTDTENFFRKNAYALGFITLIADENQAHVLEYDITHSDNKQIRETNSKLKNNVFWNIPNSIAAVNSFMLPGSFENQDAHNIKRFRNFETLYQNKLSRGHPIDNQDMQDIAGYTSTDGSAVTSGTIFRLGTSSDEVTTYQSLIFKADTFELWMAFSPVGRYPFKPTYYKIFNHSPF